MSDLTKIAVDAMGGDGSPKKIIDGIIHSHKSNKKNFFKIFGNKIKIETLIKDKLNIDFMCSAFDLNSLEFINKLLKILRVIICYFRE